MDTTDKQLKELTVENKRQKEDGRGNVSYEWHRPSGSRNELWDLTVYAHAGAEIVAYIICRQHYQLDTIDWPTFWDFMEGMLPEADPNNIR
jgi:phage terminase large subunit GpA-like protein